MKELSGRKIHKYGEYGTIRDVDYSSIEFLRGLSDRNPSSLTDVFIEANNKCVYSDQIDVYFYPDSLIDKNEGFWVRFYHMGDKFIEEDTKEKLIARLV